MDLIDRLREIASGVSAKLDHLQTEEATKNALVMPFIQALGYDVFDPTQVVPEFTADVGTKKGEKVDYAILRDGKPIMLFECKSSGASLEKEHASQLYRYFSVTPARVGVLTNGIEYRFYSDLDEPNRMDTVPFLHLDMTALTESGAREIKKFGRETFDLDGVLSAATELKYTAGIQRVLATEWVNPSDEFVKLLASRVYPGRMTQNVRDQFQDIAKRALHQFVTDRVNGRLKSALEREISTAAQREAETDRVEDSEAIETTEDELQGFYIVKAIVSDTVDPRRVFLRDGKSYCAVIVDDNNRKPLCRLWFNRSRRYVRLVRRGQAGDTGTD